MKSQNKKKSKRNVRKDDNKSQNYYKNRQVNFDDLAEKETTNREANMLEILSNSSINIEKAQMQTKALSKIRVNGNTY